MTTTEVPDDVAGRRLCGYNDEWDRASDSARAAWTRAAGEIDELHRAAERSLASLPPHLAGPVQTWLRREAAEHRRHVRTVVCYEPGYHGPPRTPLASVKVALDMAHALLSSEQT